LSIVSLLDVARVHVQRCRRMKLCLGLTCILLWAATAHAGGFELPGNDAEALGRGAAFTAKADDGAALDYNIAGLARQRGTRILLGANLLLHDYTFQRTGNFPGSTGDAKTPYAGQPYPLLANQAGPFVAPLVAVSTDFGFFERWTFAIGLFAPSAVGNRSYGLTTGNVPSPGRYDLVSENLLIVYPTVAAALRIFSWLDVGAALHVVIASFDLQNASILPLSSTACPTAEYQPCDVPTRVQTTGVTATAAVGLMLHPLRTIDIGVNLRGPVALDTSGNVSNPQLDVGHNADLHLPAQMGTAQFYSHLPWVLRVGLRYRFLAADGFEHGDIELDGNYEAWGQAEHDGDRLHVDTLGVFVKDLTTDITRHYHDTYGVRLGGAWNLRLGGLVLTLRAGMYFDSSATDDTRLDFDTMLKVAGTGGVSLRVRGIGLHAAYAYVWSPDQDVANGMVRPIDGFDGSNGVPGGAQFGVVNNGRYHARTQILSLAVSIDFETLLGRKRRR
jgi:long-subunit fatty acid transport protein